MQINRINIYFIKTVFRKRVKRKVNWNNTISIIERMSGIFYQLLDRIYWKTRFWNLHINLLILLWILMIFPISTFLLFLLRISLIPEQEETIKVIKSDSYELAVFLNATNDIRNIQYELFENEDHLKMTDQIVIICDVLICDKMNTLAINSINRANAGGASEISEAWSIHHLSEKLGFCDCVYEMEIEYFCKYKMVDYILFNDDKCIGVSVFRMICFGDFSIKAGTDLLIRKINGLIISRKCVNRKHTFYESILHIWSPSKRITEGLFECLDSDEFEPLKLEIIGTLTIWITNSENQEIYFNKFLEMK